MKFRKLRLYLRSHKFQRNAALSITAILLVGVTGYQGQRSLAHALYKFMMLANEKTKPVCVRYETDDGAAHISCNR